MRRLLFVLPFFFTFFPVSSAQHRAYWRDFGFSEGVKSARVEVATFNVRNGAFEEGERLLSSIYTFTPDGYMLTMDGFNKDGDPSYRTVFNYDPVINQEQRDSYDGIGALMSRMVTKFDSRGLKKEEVSYDGQGELSGKKVIVYGSNDTMETVSYDAAGNEIDRITAKYTLDRTVSGKLDGVYYDKAGDVIRIDSKVFGKNQAYETDQSIDKPSNTTGNGAKTRNSSTTIKSRWDSEYDSRSNIAKSTFWLWLEEKQAYRPVSASYYTITYY